MILIALPRYGFDPTEAAIPYIYLRKKNIPIVFSTPDSSIAQADKRLLNGTGFGVFKKALMADHNAKIAYSIMSNSKEFKNPISYNQVTAESFDGIILPGGHDKGIREYLESPVLRKKVETFFEQKKLIGAICHGTIVAARAINKETKHSVLYNYQTTSLLNIQELGAYTITRLWLKDYYRTYSVTVEDEVKSVLKNSSQYHTGKLPFGRDSFIDSSNAFVVKDDNYISARWPGDARSFAKIYYESLLARNIKK